MPFWPPVLFVLCWTHPAFYFYLIFSVLSTRAAFEGGRGDGCQTFYFCYFSLCSADHKRDWLSCKKMFVGLATNTTLNVRKCVHIFPPKHFDYSVRRFSCVQVFLKQQRLCCMHGHHIELYSKSQDQPGKVANPARSQMNKENEYFAFPVRAREFGFARWVRQSRPASASLSPYSG